MRVYDRPETPPSVVRRRRLTWIIAGIGLLISLLLLAVGPLRTVLGARSGPEWTPPLTETPVQAAVVATLPPGVSAAQATARARYTATPSPTIAPTWTEGVDLGTPVGGGTTGGALATPVLPTLAPAATLAPATVPPLPTLAPPPAATAPATAPPTRRAAATATVPPTTEAPATEPTAATTDGGASLPQAISGGRVAGVRV